MRPAVMGERTKKRLVVKVGTNTLTGGEDRLARPAMLGVVRQVAQLVREGHQVALVSSGAIVAGLQALSVSPNGKAASARTDHDASDGESHPNAAAASGAPAPRRSAAAGARRRDIPFKQVLAA